MCSLRNIHVLLFLLGAFWLCLLKGLDPQIGKLTVFKFCTCMDTCIMCISLLFHFERYLVEELLGNWDLLYYCVEV